jgi:magnesium-transporting ATPase (P-type)
MRRPPRRKTQRLVDNRLMARAFLWLGLIEAVLCYVGFFLVLGGPEGVLSLPLIREWDSLAGLLSRALDIPAGLRLGVAVTVFHAGVVMAQVGNAFACRTETHRGRSVGWFSNPFLLFGVLVEILIILALIYIPPLADAFEHVPLPPVFWLGLSLYPLILYGLEWLRKSFVRRRSRPFLSNGVPHTGNE